MTADKSIGGRSSPGRWILLGLVTSSALAYWWPAGAVGFDLFKTPPSWLWTLIVVTMFSLGTLVRPEELEPLRRHPWWVALGVLTQLAVMPAAAWAVTWLLPLSPELTAGVILVGSVPGAMASNVLTHTARGSVAYSVSLTVTATLLSPLTVPAVLALLLGEMPDGQTADQQLVDPRETSLALLLRVVVPVVAGYLVARASGLAERHAQRIAPPLASLALLWIIAGVVAANRDRLAQVEPILLIGLLAINVVGYVAGSMVGRLGRLPTRYRRALSLEVGMQNAGLGTALAASLFGTASLATIPTAAYTFGCMFTGTCLAGFWASRPASDSPHVADP